MAKKSRAFDKSKYQNWIDPATVQPYERNAKIHTDKQVQNIVNSIERFGWQQDAVLTADNVLVIGHGRRLAALQIGCKMPYHVIDKTADELTDEDIRELRIVDNQTNAETGMDFSALEVEIEDLSFDGFDFDFGFDFDDEEEPAEIVEDEAPEEVETRCKLGDVWRLGNHRLMCGDSTDPAVIDRLMDGVKADMVFTDPPYNCNYGNIKHPKFKQREIKNDNMDAEAFRSFCVDFTLNIKQYVTGCVYMCAGQGKDGRIMFTVADELLNNSTTIIWNKDHFTLGRGKYQNKYEPIWFGWVESGKDFCDDRTLTNVWDIKRPIKSELHPTMKPIELIATALKHNPKSKTVLDLFGGSGSTLIACEQLNRKCYMCELDPHYVDVIIARWEQFTGQKAEKLS